MSTQIEQISLEAILYDENYNPRDIGAISEAEGKNAKVSIESLADNIKEIGLLAPIVIEQIPDKDVIDYQYRIIAGHRRYKAYELLAKNDGKYKKIPSIIFDTLSEVEKMYITLAENLSRKDAKVDEQARGIYKLYLIMQSDNPNAGYGTIAKKLGIARSYVQKLVNKEKKRLDEDNKGINAETEVKKVTVSEAKQILSNASNSIETLQVNLEECDINDKVKLKEETTKLYKDVKRVLELIREIDKALAKDADVKAKRKSNAKIKAKVNEVINIMGGHELISQNNIDIF